MLRRQSPTRWVGSVGGRSLALALALASNQRKVSGCQRSPRLGRMSYGGKTTVARAYLAGLAGVSLPQVDRIARVHGLTRAAAERPGPCPLDVPVTATIAGRPWRPRIDFTEAPALLRHLGTAAFIVCAYLTGIHRSFVGSVHCKGAAGRS